MERPGLDRVREMVRGGAVDAVAVLFRDRIARGVYAQLLSEEFRQHGARLVALNSRGDDSPDGELGDNILDVIAAWERKKIGERMNRGKVRKTREGKIVAGPSPNYGNQRRGHCRFGGRASPSVAPRGLRARQRGAARIPRPPCPQGPRQPHPGAEAHALSDDAPKGRCSRRGAYYCRLGL